MSSGGKRKGAGRKPTGKKRVQYKLDPQVAAEFSKRCRAMSIPISEEIEGLMREWLSCASSRFPPVI
jgi:hypothetical protein